MRFAWMLTLVAMSVAVSLLAQAPGIRRTVLQQVDISAPGREVVTAKVELPPSISTGRHTHHGEEIGYVLDGQISIEIDGRTTIVRAGNAFVIPTGTVHDAVNTGAVSAAVLVNYVVEKGKPLVVPVP